MVQSTASDQHTLVPNVLSDAPERLSASNPGPIAAASASVPMSIPTDGGTFGSGPDTLVLTLAEDAFQGNAQANVTIDGITLTAQPITITALKSAGQSEAFTFKGSFGSGAHDLGVSFLNDAYGGTPTTDRNLYVNGASYDGFSTRPASAVLDSAGTTHLTIPPAGDPEATPTITNGGTFGSGPDTLVLTLAEDAFQGDAQANVAIDGTTLTTRPITVTALESAGQSETFTFKGSFGSGAHDLGVSFLNDAYGGTPTTDRNLYVNGASYDGISTRPASAVLDSAGTTHLTIPPAGDPEATPAITGGGTFGSGPDTLVVTLAEDAFQGNAQANIAIDGKMLNVQPITFIAQPLTVTALNSAGQSEAFTFKGSFGSGAHDLAVSFLNDAYGGTPITDRNLYVNGASFNGLSFSPATAALDTTGTAHFAIRPVASPGGAVSLIGAAQNTTDAMHSIMPALTGS